MLRMLSFIAVLGSMLLLPYSAQAEKHGLVNIQQEYQDLKQYFSFNPQLLKDALEAYDCGVATGHAGRPDILTIIDYQLPSSDKRLWVIDLARHRLLYNTYVAHGAGSGKADATYFSNSPRSKASSIGLYETGNSYNGDWGYAMRLYGLENGYNSNAYRRAIVMHGGRYVSMISVLEHGMIGMSDGCLAVPTTLDHSIINSVRDGTLIFAYYPKHYWLETSRFLHCSVLKTYSA